MKIGAFLQNSQQKIITCSPTDTAHAAATMMKEMRIGAMPVINEHGKLCGMISERDLTNGFSTHGSGLEKLLVKDLLAKHVIFMGPGAGMHDAMETMHKHGFRHVPILADGEVIGIVSIRDVLALFVHNFADYGLELKVPEAMAS